MTSSIKKNKLFIEKHTGGNLDDTIEEYNNKKDIINENKTKYSSLLDENKKNEREDDISLYKKEIYEKNYRINNTPTIVNKTLDVSNPTIYPKEYDPYFEYKNDKNLYIKI